MFASSFTALPSIVAVTLIFAVLPALARGISTFIFLRSFTGAAFILNEYLLPETSTTSVALFFLRSESSTPNEAEIAGFVTVAVTRLGSPVKATLLPLIAPNDAT